MSNLINDRAVGTTDSADDSKLFRLPPVAIFWDGYALTDLPQWDAETRYATERSIAALESIPIYTGIVDRDAGLADAAAVVGALVQAAGTKTGLPDVAGLPPRSPVEEYFRVRAANLTPVQAALQAAIVIERGLRDLRSVPLSGNDLTWELASMRQAIIDVFGDQQEAGHEPVRPTTEATGAAPAAPAQDDFVMRKARETWLARWIIGHHVHALLNVCATAAVNAAIDALRAGDSAQAVADLHRATTYARGIPAARAHAAAMPSDFYCAVVRPTMMPTLVAVPLSGSMHIGYRAYRKALQTLTKVLPDPVVDLAPREPDLAFAREALFEADIVEAERHVSLAESAVGDARSLVQSQTVPENAVASLRKMRHIRAARYQPFIRFADDLAAQHLTQDEDSADS